MANNSANHSGSAVRFMSWNVKGLNGPVKRGRILSHIKNLKTDIAFLQETHLSNSDQMRLKKHWVGQIFHSSFNSKSRGTAIIMHKKIQFNSSSVISDPQGRYVIVSGTLYQTPVLLVNIYAPNWDDAGFVQRVVSQLPDLDANMLILGGDLNCVMSANLDRSNPKTQTLSKMASRFSEFFNHAACVDPWRHFNPHTKTFSFYSNVHHTYSRIDYFFVDRRLLNSVEAVEYLTIVESDHAPIIMNLIFCQNFSSRSHWRFNTTLLSDNTFCTSIEIAIQRFLETNSIDEVSPSLLWETLKAYLRGEIIAYSSFINKERKKQKQQLIEAIFELDKKNSIAPNASLHKERISLQTQYNLISTSETERLIMRSRGSYYEQGEKSGRLLAHQLKSKSAAQIISEIEDEGGSTTTDPLRINNIFKDFYSDLYSSESLKDTSLFHNFFLNLEVPTLSSDQKEFLDEPIELREVSSAISAMQNGKSPGPDGFPIDFYKKFSKQLAPLLLDMFDDAMSKSKLPNSLNEATITLLLKPGKDASKCGSYRPISLLNTDLKILSKLLATRLEKTLPYIISPDQTGFIKNRHLFSNIRRLLNILYSPSSTNIPEIVVSLDAFKAFDRVEMDFLFYVLKKFGFGKAFIKWIQLLYSSPQASVITNRIRSQNFPLSRGTRQGCPLSPLLFTLVIEPLALALKSTPSIRGIRRWGLESKLSLYADDLLLYLSDPLNSINTVISVLQNFGQISGYKLNLEKSECLPINSLAMQIPNHALPFHISRSGFKYLGINITPSFNNLFDENLAPLMSKLNSDLQRWDVLHLTMAGRVNCIKMNVLPRFLFLFQCIPIFLPKSFFTKLDKIISRFIWKGQNPRIKKEFLQRSKLAGGLALPNFRAYYWAANFHKIAYWIQSADTDWCEMEYMSCTSSSPLALVSSNLPMKISRFTSNPVVISTLKIWAQFRKQNDLRDTLLTYSPLCNNHNFLPANLDHTFVTWHRKGIKRFSDLYINGSFSCFEDLCAKYELQQKDMFRYFQARQFARSHSPHFPILPSESVLDLILKAPFFLKGFTTHCYAIIRKTDIVNTDKIKNHWENELGTEISEDTWTDTLKRVNSSTSCARLNLIQFKVAHRLHWSRARISSIYPNVDSNCIRCHIHVADLTHMFWSCHLLMGYWSDIFDVLSKVFGVTLQPCAMIALFGVPNKEANLTKNQQNIVAFVSLLARRQILLHWKSSAPPTVAQWLKDVMLFLHLEKIKFAIRRSDKFKSVWEPFLSYFSDLQELPPTLQ